MASPLLAKKQENTSVAPYWYAHRVAKDNTMKAEKKVFNVMWPYNVTDSTASPKELKAYKWRVIVPVFINRKMLNRTELITLPHYREALK